MVPFKIKQSEEIGGASYFKCFCGCLESSLKDNGSKETVTD